MQPFHHAAAWSGDEILQRTDWQLRLDAESVEEIEAAVAHTRQRQLALEDITVDDFPLPSLGMRLGAAQDSLEQGTGSFVLRGWPIDAHSLDDHQRVFWGISRHLGTPISQSAKGERIFRVENAGFQQGDARLRGPNSSSGLSFHCDRCDVIGFLCVRQAQSGGENCLVSSLSVHNAILDQRPDLLEELYRPWYYKTHNVDVANDDPWCRQPIFAVEQGHFVGYVLRVLIDRAYALPELPDMTAKQSEALEFLDQVCNDPSLHTRFRQQPGDMLFVNNFVNFHSRTEFEDHPSPDRRRLLLRIWLSVPNSRPLPASFAGSFGQTAAGAIRGGIHPA